MKKYDYLIVGAGLFGAVFARQMNSAGKKVLVVEKRSHIGGTVYTEKTEGILCHKYGAHIFFTNSKTVWDYISQFAVFNRFTNSPVANYKGTIYSLPFNMYTFNRLWGVRTPEEAYAALEKQKIKIEGEPHNLEEKALCVVGRDVYEKLVKGYSEKQWGRPCCELPPTLMNNLPFRMMYDNNYYNAAYQGVPVGGYTPMIEKLLEGSDVVLQTDYLQHKAEYDALAKKVVYTGAIDAYFNYCFGCLEYRTLKFETVILDKPNFQGNAVVNYTDVETPWTRIIEHKWFTFGKDESGKDFPKTVISKEYSSAWEIGKDPYYPINDEKNNRLFGQYRKLAEKESNVIFGGRLAEYRYYRMTEVIESALNKAAEELAKG